MMLAINRFVAMFLGLVMAVNMRSCFFRPVSGASSGHFDAYETVASAKDRSNCCSMQGMAVDSSCLYTVKINRSNNKAFISKTSTKTGDTIPLMDPTTGSIYLQGLGHANDMDVTTLKGKSTLFIATMNSGSHSLVRMEADGTHIKKTGSYTLEFKGDRVHVSGVAITEKTDSSLTFLFKRGETFYTGSLHPDATTGTISLTKAFRLNTSSVKVNGRTMDLSNYLHQGFCYHENRLFVPLTTPRSKKNISIIAVYNVADTTGRITPCPKLSFCITSRAFGGLFEIESCGISPDGRLYFNTNRRKTDTDTNHDGIHYFKGYTF